MKKSCPGKELKVVTTKDADENHLNNSKEDSKEYLTEEQLNINKQLSESGIDGEGLGWLEKRNIVRTLNVSLDSAESERLQRISPRLSNSVNSKVKWVENSFENTKTENLNNEKNSKLRSVKRESKLTPTRKASPLCVTKKAAEKFESSTPKQENQKETSNFVDQSQKDDNIVCDSPKSSKKVYYIKIQVEGKEDSSEVRNTEEDCPSLNAGKKRASHSEKSSADAPKKLKMEETNNGLLPPPPQEEQEEEEEDNRLRVELELEKRRRNCPFVARDIESIVSECEIRNQKWKETFSKFKCPTRWGSPIVRNCTEKWDGKQIPPKLLHRYQKYLSSNNLFHPVFYPVSSQSSSVDLNKFSGGDISSQSSTCTNSECRDEGENDFKDLGEGSFVQDESKKTPGEINNLNASTSSGSDTTGRMVLRTRNQQKAIPQDEDEYSSDDSDDWLSKQKPNKKQKINSKIKKPNNADQNNKQLVLKLERCNLNKRNGNEGVRKNGNKNEVGFTGGSLLGQNNAMANSKMGPDPDTMVCPICSMRFKKQLIESHATECASKTYKD